MGCCILVAGMPASGKTTFAVHLAEKLSLPMISKDRIKELLYDTVGFQSRVEKVTLSIASTQMLYYFAESLMRTGASFVMENNFENVQKKDLQGLIQRYGYRPVTVRFGGDVHVIYERYLQRNSQWERHGGHKTNSAWPLPQGETVLSSPMTIEEFISGIKSRGIAEFTLGGEEIYVDTTDFSRVSYDDILDRVKSAIDNRDKSDTAGKIDDL